jgi:hypothetical protein
VHMLKRLILCTVTKDGWKMRKVFAMKVTLDKDWSCIGVEWFSGWSSLYISIDAGLLDQILHISIRYPPLLVVLPFSAYPVAVACAIPFHAFNHSGEGVKVGRMQTPKVM